MLPGSETAKRFAVFIKAYIKKQMLGYKKKTLSHSSFFINPAQQTTVHLHKPGVALICLKVSSSEDTA